MRKQSQLTVIRWIVLGCCFVAWVPTIAAQQGTGQPSPDDAAGGSAGDASDSSDGGQSEAGATEDEEGLPGTGRHRGGDGYGEGGYGGETYGVGRYGGYDAQYGGYDAQYGGYDAQYGGGGYGGMMDGYGGARRLPLQFAIIEGQSEDGKPQLSKHTAMRVREFRYQQGSFKPIAVSETEGGEYGGGMYGGPGMMGPGGPGMGRASKRGSQAVTISIIAYLFDDNRENGRSRIELVTPPPAKPRKNNSAGPGGMGGGFDGYGMMGGGRTLRQYVRFESLAKPEANEQGFSFELSPREVEIVADTIRLSLWREDVIAAIYQQPRDEEALATLESQLKSILTAQFETQIARQRLEIEQVEQKVEQLKDDLQQRAAVQDRAVEVQLGRIVLEAQGLLGK